MKAFAILTAIGSDRVGIVDDLTAAILERQCNVEESRMTVLGGEFSIFAGGKGASLARLIRAGYPVPAGFVIPTAAFRAPISAVFAAAGPGLRRGGGDPPIEDWDLQAARRLCLDWEMPVKLRRAILHAYRRLGPGPVAVRLAGGVPVEGEPLFSLTRGRPKALLPVAEQAGVAPSRDHCATAVDNRQDVQLLPPQRLLEVLVQKDPVTVRNSGFNQ